ncbi:MAG: glycosyltransferase family 2 protein [Gammaproteobacteria bacterium]|nr:glycosyltransferase family 2 protein [Gammaproteobacteria bacterium]
MPAPIPAISAVLITRDAARTIERCLAALEDFGEVVVLDTGSTDATVDKVRAFANARLHHGEFHGFGAAKNQAAALARNDWIFSIDADEIMDAELAAALARWDAAGDAHRLGVVLRRNFFMGRHVARGGWGGDTIARLFHRRHHRFSDSKVHESISLTAHSKKRQLPGRLDHHTAPDPGSFLNKVRDYSALAAEQATVRHPAMVVLRALAAFVKSYVLQLGFLAGWRGLVIAWSNANGVFYKYMWAWALRKK